MRGPQQLMGSERPDALWFPFLGISSRKCC